MRTIYDTGRLAQVKSEMRRYNLQILGISDSRWTRSGRFRTSTGETVLYSGRDDDQHHEGVAIAYHPQERYREMLDGVETGQQQTHQDQAEREADKHDYHTVLCPYK